MEIVDARGQVCPRPIIMTKNVFDELEEGTVKTQVDDMYCVENLQKYANGQGFEFSYEETDYGFETTIVKELSLIHISEPTRRTERSRMPSSA